MDETRPEVLQGTLDLMVLQTLDTMGPQHGYAIAARLEQVSEGALQLNMGTLYPGLMRLEQRGLVKGSWGTTERVPDRPGLVTRSSASPGGGGRRRGRPSARPGRSHGT